MVHELEKAIKSNVKDLVNKNVLSCLLKDSREVVMSRHTLSMASELLAFHMYYRVCQRIPIFIVVWWSGVNTVARFIDRVWTTNIED